MIRSPLRSAASAILCALLASVALGCSGGGGGTASTTTTESPAIASSIPPAPSTIAPDVSICGTLADLYGIDDLELHPGNWIQERQRVLTDGNREARLLRSAIAGARDPLRASLQRLSTWVDGVVAAVTAAGSYDAARVAVAGLDRSGLAPAASAVVTWRDANC